MDGAAWRGGFHPHRAGQRGLQFHFRRGRAGAYLSDRRWAKLCYEFSPERKPTAVTVVTHGTSDDSNSSRRKAARCGCALPGRDGLGPFTHRKTAVTGGCCVTSPSVRRRAPGWASSPSRRSATAAPRSSTRSATGRGRPPTCATAPDGLGEYLTGTLPGSADGHRAGRPRASAPRPWSSRRSPRSRRRCSNALTGMLDVGIPYPIPRERCDAGARPARRGRQSP